MTSRLGGSWRCRLQLAVGKLSNVGAACVPAVLPPAGRCGQTCVAILVDSVGKASRSSTDALVIQSGVFLGSLVFWHAHLSAAIKGLDTGRG